MESVLLFAALAVVGSGGCKGAPAPAGDDPVAPVTSATAATPIDHLAPNELVEGTDRAFGLPFPRGFKVNGVFADYARAEGAFSARAVESFYRARLAGGVVKADGRTVTFESMRRKDGSGPRLEVRVFPSKDQVTVVEIVDREPSTPTAARAKSTMTDDQRFRAAGIDRQGRLLNPKQLE